MENSYSYPDLNDKVTAAAIRATGVDGAELQRQETEVLCHLLSRQAAGKTLGRLLDYGSGEGRLSLFFSPLSQKVTAYEPDRQRRINHQRQFSGLVSNVEVLESFDRAGAANEFDVAICSHVIQHVTRTMVEEVLADLAAALRSGGNLLLLTTFTGGAAGDASRYVVSRLSAGNVAIETEVSANEFDQACTANQPGKLPIHFFGMGELLGLMDRHEFHDVTAYGLHGDAGVVGPISADASLAEALRRCRDVAVLAVRQ